VKISVTYFLVNMLPVLSIWGQSFLWRRRYQHLCLVQCLVLLEKTNKYNNESCINPRFRML